MSFIDEIIENRDKLIGEMIEKLHAKDAEITELIGKLNAAKVQLEQTQRLLDEVGCVCDPGPSAVERFRRDVARMSEDAACQVEAEIVSKRDA